MAGILTLLATVAGAPVLAGHGGAGSVPGYSAEHVRRFLDAGERVVLVDVRPATAYRQGRLPGARSIPLGELERRSAEVPRTGRVILYGDSIVEASEAHARLWDKGHRNVGVLEDGFRGWVRLGFPVEPGR
jgi:rhodanese-related sulfurtransferase